MLRTPALVLVVLVAASVASPFIVDTPHGTLTLEGRQKRGADANIAGVFRSLEGDGIRFRSTLDSLEVTTMDGQNLVKVVRHPAAAQTYGEEAKTTLYQFLDDAYVEANRQTYRISPEHFIAAANSFALPNYLANVQASGVPVATMQTTVDRLAAHPAARLLEPAARALGQELGIVGKEEPAAMAFYTTAMTLTEAYNKNRRARVSLARKSNPWDTYTSRRVNTQGKFPDCDQKACPPCQEDQCFGLCGYGCNCWAFVCGDCCYHLGCKDHDICCRDSFFSTSCIFPFWFSCDEPYEC